MADYSWTSGYDFQDRLTSFERTGTANDQSWTLTKAGDWDDTTRGGTSEDRSHSAVHEITSLSPGPTPTYDAKGNVLTDGTRTYTWDQDKMLSQIVVSGGPTITFKYDVLGRRLIRTSTPTMGSATTTRYILRSQSEGGQALAEEDNASGTYRLFVWGDYVDDLLARIKSDGTRHTFHANRMYSVAAVSDGSGSIVERYAYTAYGDPSIKDASGGALTSSAIGNNYLFTGREWDAEAGVYYYRARYYDPRLGRFLGRDPIGYSTDYVLYAYVGSDPLSRVDPTGLTAQGASSIADALSGITDLLSIFQLPTICENNTTVTFTGQASEFNIHGTADPVDINKEINKRLLPQTKSFSNGASLCKECIEQCCRAVEIRVFAAVDLNLDIRFNILRPSLDIRDLGAEVPVVTKITGTLHLEMRSVTNIGICRAKVGPCPNPSQYNVKINNKRKNAKTDLAKAQQMNLLPTISMSMLLKDYLGW